MKTSSPKAALITGAGSGIGRATALRLADQGFEIILVGRRKAVLEEVAQSLSCQGHVFACDLTNAEQVTDLIAHIKKFPLEILVNNAATFERRLAAEADDAHWTRHWETNVLAPVRLTRGLIPHFVQRESGSIVNVSSTLGLRPIPGTGAYSAGKAALINWTQCLALELAPHRVRVNCVCPGIVDTPIHGSSHGKMADFDDAQPLGRVGRPEEIAAAIAYFCQPDAAWTTGAVLNVDGGINIS